MMTLFTLIRRRRNMILPDMPYIKPIVSPDEAIGAHCDQVPPVKGHVGNSSIMKMFLV